MDKLQQLRDRLAAGFGVAELRQAEKKAGRNHLSNQTRFGNDHPTTKASYDRWIAAMAEARKAVQAEKDTKAEIERLSASVATPEELDEQAAKIRSGWEKIPEIRNTLIAAAQKIADTPVEDVVRQAALFDEIVSFAEDGSSACWDIKAAENKRAELLRRGIDD